jgi:mono/diheme cytochrome c family protein
VAPKQDLSPIPAEAKDAADADRGRETFRVAGCLACHNLAGYPGQDLATKDFAFDENEYNDHGPDLRGVASKIDETWLYHWIKDPESYWDETRMPNLRLSDQEAADITAYFMEDPDGIFRDEPPTWDPQASPFKADVLQEMVRHFYSRLGREEITRRINGEVEEHRWDQADDLLLAVGEKHVAYSGCFSCHEISGFEDMNPIGVELTTWGSKTVDKLAWEFRAKILAHENGWDQDTRDEFKHYRENWIGEKLSNPRIFDDEKVRLPLDRLRMPHFGLTDDEIVAVSNFVVGLVNDEVQRAEMVETPEQQSMNLGMQAVRQNNCMACHVVEPAQVTYLDEDGAEWTVAAEALPLGDADTPPRMLSLAGLQVEITESEEKYDAEVEEIIFRTLENTPGIGPIGTTFFVEPGNVLDIVPAQGGAFVATVLDYYKHGIPMHTGDAWTLGGEGKVGDVDGETRSYQDVDYNGVRWTFAPPVLIDEGGKLQRDWFYNFLMDPFILRPQMRVKMPTFNLTEEEAAGIADYFAYKSKKDWPARFTRALHTATAMEPGTGMTNPGKAWPELSNHAGGGQGMSFADLANAIGIKESVLRAIESGYQPDIEASFDKVLAYATEEANFSMSPAVAPGLETISQRANSYHSNFEIGSKIGTVGVDCFKCHWFNGNGPSQMDTPVAWAPDLAVTRERLRPDWTKDWLWNPALIYPGTAMPGNFLAAEPAYQEQFPDSNNQQQIEAVLDWLYRLDKETAAAGN